MAKQVVGLFDNTQDAQGAVQDLRNAGFAADDISIVANNARGEYGVSDGGTEAAEGAGAGATGGAILGGLGGLLVGLGALAIPGIGPVVAAGTLATTLGTTLAGAGLGAAAGGLVGALTGAGIPENDANVYAEGVRRGGALVTVQAASDDDADRAADILDRHNVVDIDERATNYRSSGWSRFDENTGAYESTGAGMRDTGYATAGTSSTGMRDTGYDSDTVRTGDSTYDRSSKAGTAVGGVSGAATGAAIGSVGGPVGAVVGGVAGALAGAGAGAAGDTAGEAAREGTTGDTHYDRTASSTGYDRTTTDTGMRDSAAIGSATDYGSSGTTTGHDTIHTGTAGYDTTRAATTGYETTQTGATGYAAGTRDIGREEGEVAIPVVREEVQIGKREVESGGVRVSTEVHEQPVQEQVTLREEQVHVERRPVDRAVDGATVSEAFQEGTFEVRERAEVPIVHKEARVVEEVVVGKEARERQETVQETARQTQVNVEEIPGETRTTGYTETARTGAVDMGTTGHTETGHAGASDVGMTGHQDTSTIGGTSSTRYEDLSSTTRSSSGEGPIESTLGNAESAVERGTGLDLNQSGGVGDRDRRDNY